MLAGFLSSTPREPSGYASFAVIDLSPSVAVGEEHEVYLAGLLTTSRFSAEFLKYAAGLLGSDALEAKISASQPLAPSARRGEFGEALASAIIEEFHSYNLPVRKLQFKITRGQSLPSTDVLGLLLDDQGRITEVCFLESKLRTQTDNGAAVAGYKQLKNDYEQELPDMLMFVAQRLFDSDSPHLDAFMQYLRSRSEEPAKDSFRLCLCWETSAWSEEVLSNLQDNEIELDALTVHVVAINQLAQLVERVFGRVGVSEILDDD